MTTKPTPLIQMPQDAESPALSQAQKQFNKLIKKIERLRELLSEWQTTLPLYQQKYQTELLPLMTSYNEQRVKLVHLFDRAWAEKGFSKSDRDKLAYIISDLIDRISQHNPDPALEQIYDKYNAPDEQGGVENSILKSADEPTAEEIYGEKIDDDIDFTDPQSLRQFLDAKEQEWEQEALARQEKASKRKKTAKQIAKENLQAKEEKDSTLSIREVYRKLASALHPDREPNEEERGRKTKLMQRVNVAYEKKDLLQLLQLQLEIEQIDAHAISTLSETKLSHYNKILGDQSKELEMEIAHFSSLFDANDPFSFGGRDKISPDLVMRGLKTEVHDMRSNIGLLKQDVRLFEDPQHIKAMLKSYRIPNQSMFDADFVFGL